MSGRFTQVLLYCKNLRHPGAVPFFWQQNHYLNKLGKVQLGDAAYQLSRLLALWFQTRRFILFSTSKPIPGNAIFGPRQLFGPLGDIMVLGNVVSDKIFYAPNFEKVEGAYCVGLVPPSVSLLQKLILQF